MSNILEVDGLRKVYAESQFVLKDIDFSIPYGSIVGFIGENGAGKTTTMGAILGTLKKDRGAITIFGKKVDVTKPKIREDIGVVFDDMNFSSHLNVDQLAKVMKNIYQQWDNDKYNHYIQLFSLPKKQKIAGFSRGMSMKLSIAVALSHGAKLLILDEATAGLDPVARDDILEVFIDFVKDKDHAIFLSSHITSDIEKIADELIFIKNGEIILKVNKDELLHNYAIVQCRSDTFHEINEDDVLAYITKDEMLNVLVSNKHGLPRGCQISDFTIDDITLLLMKGENNERTHS